MIAIIVHSTSKEGQSLKIAQALEGETFRIEHVKRVYKSRFMQMFMYGYETTTNKSVKIKPISIDLKKYDEIYLVSPVWAGQINAYMKQFLKEHPLKNKRVHIIGSCDGGHRNYFNTVESLLDSSNQIVEKTIYVKGEKA